VKCRVEKVLCSWESPFASCLAGAPGGDYLSRAIVDCSGAPTADTAFMGLTSCRWITIAKTLARRRRVAQPASCQLRVAIERAADRYTLICDGRFSPVGFRMQGSHIWGLGGSRCELSGHRAGRPASPQNGR
jgi:hypothetical protein